MRIDGGTGGPPAVDGAKVGRARNIGVGGTRVAQGQRARRRRKGATGPGWVGGRYVVVLRTWRALLGPKPCKEVGGFDSQYGTFRRLFVYRTPDSNGTGGRAVPCA